MIRDKTELKNYKYDIRIISTHQGLIVKGKIVSTREIIEVTYTSYYEIANKFYQNPLNRITDERIINLFEAKYEESVEISKEDLIEKSKLKNWYQSQSNDQGQRF